MMSRRGWLMFLAMGVLWGIPYLFIKIAVRELSSADIVFARTFVGALLLLPIAWRRGALRPVVRLWRWLVVFATAEIAIPWLLIADAERRLPSALVGMLISLVPIFATIFMWLVLDRTVLPRARIVGLLIGVLGVGLLLGLDALSRPMSPANMGEILLVAFLYAVAPILADRKLSGVPAVGVIAVSLSAVATGYLPFAVWTLPAAWPSTTALASLAVLAVFCTSLAFVIFFALIAEIGPLRAGVVTFVNPAVAVFLGITVLSEPLTLGTVVGFPLVLLGSWLATRPAPGLRERSTDIAAKEGETQPPHR
jgi:drug/metabolite transporter (DMT)-like permease